MEVARVQITDEEAKTALREYRSAKAPKTAQDIAIMQAYRAVARGKKIIRAHELIRQAGLDSLGRPVLAIARADAKFCECQVRIDAVSFRDPSKSYRQTTAHSSVTWRVPEGTPTYKWHRAIVPLVPLHLRPKGPLVPYHVLWEADWEEVPVDPMLLKKLSGDLWLVSLTSNVQS